MRWRVIFGFSLLANLVLAIALMRSGSSGRDSGADQAAVTNSITSTNTKTAVIVRRQFFSWQELESRDYPTYIKNLRDIGCPEQTIRDIIIADVTAMLRQKYAGEQADDHLLKPNPRWWTNRRTTAEMQKAQQQSNAMAAERNAILTQLLGPDWASGEPVTKNRPSPYESLLDATLELDPVLQSIAPENKQALVKLFLSSGINHVVIPEPYTKAEAAAERERWAKAREILTADQWERAKLYFSIHAESLRNQLDGVPGFDVRPEEFRSLFLATEDIDEQLALLYGSDDATANTQIQSLLQQRDQAFRTSLSGPRYELLVRLQDPAYRSAIETLAAGGDPKALRVLYAINREASAEEQRIQNDETLTETQREIELKKLELDQLKATALAMGEKLIEEDEPPKAAPEPMKVHTVLPGEGIERIARIYGVPPEQLQAANPNLDFKNLPPGANLNIPLQLMYPLPPPVRQ